jgi:hypothetical protein
MLNPFAEFQAPHAWHVDVCHDEVGRAVVSNVLQTLFGAGRGDRFEPGLANYFGVNASNGARVV